jgi:hypothetical protein
MKQLLPHLLAVFVLATALPAQLHLGVSAYSTTEVIDASGAPTHVQANLSKAGTGIAIGSGFDVYVIVEIRDENGTLLFSGTVAPNDFLAGTHNLPSGKHDILACDAGSPPPQQCGTVCVE